MGLMDDMKSNASGMMDNDEMKQRIQNYADEHNCSFEEAKQHFMDKKDEQ